MKLLVKDEGKVGALVYLVDSEGRLLDTEPLCLIYSRYFPGFFNWLQKKFRGEFRNLQTIIEEKRSEGKGFAFQPQKRTNSQK